MICEKERENILTWSDILFAFLSKFLRTYADSNCDDIVVKIEKNFEDIGSFLMKERWNEKKKQYDLFLFQIFSTIGRNYIELTKL